MEVGCNRLHKYRATTRVSLAAEIYNKYKNSADTCDYLIRNVSNGYKCRHSYVAKGIHFLSILWVNSYCCYVDATRSQKSITLQDFTLKMLAMQIEPNIQMEMRASVNVVSQNSILWCRRYPFIGCSK